MCVEILFARFLSLTRKLWVAFLATPNKFKKTNSNKDLAYNAKNDINYIRLAVATLDINVKDKQVDRIVLDHVVPKFQFIAKRNEQMNWAIKWHNEPWRSALCYATNSLV